MIPVLCLAVVALTVLVLATTGLALHACRTARAARGIAEQAVSGMAAELTEHLEYHHPLPSDEEPARRARVAHLRGLVARVAAVDVTLDVPQGSAERLLLAQERAQGAQARAQLRALGEEA